MLIRYADTYQNWRSKTTFDEYEDERGFCKTTTTEGEIKEHEYIIVPGRYVGAPPLPDDGEPFEEKMKRLLQNLENISLNPAVLRMRSERIWGIWALTSETVPLSEFCTVRKGLSYKGEFIHKKGPALLGIGTIKEGGGFRAENVRTYGGPYKETHVLRPGDVYVALTSQDGLLIGSPAMVPKDFQGIGITTHHDAKIDWKTEDQDMKDFLYWLMHSYGFIRHCINFSVGTTVYATHGKDVERFQVPKQLNHNPSRH